MRKTAGLLAAGLALTLTLVGCGTKTAGSPTAGDGAAGSNSSDGGALKVFGNALDLAGAVNNKSKDKQTFKVSMDGSAAGQSLKGDGAFDLSGADPKLKMAMNLGTLGQMEMVVVGKVLYIKIPASLGSSMGAPTDKPWFKISSDGTDPLSKTLGPMLDQLGNNFDIAKQMDQIKNAGTIDKSVKETLNGEETTHYYMTVDVVKAMENVPMDPQLKQKAIDVAKQSGNTTSKTEMWVNRDNLPVQVVSSSSMAGQTVKVTTKYTDWGKPVTIAAPPENQIAQLPR
jgi:hypothetical protein